ncbi:MAG: ComF family protein [Pseudomonadota bacterium]
MGGHMAQQVGSAKARAARALSRGASMLWPSRSLLSDARGAGGGALPPEDWVQLAFLGPPQCDSCGLPVDIDLGEAQTCAACIAKPPPWNRARAALAYNDASRRIVLDIKRAGRRDGLSLVGSWMATAGTDLLGDADLIVPVPLHYRRLVSRGFNQAGWLAQVVARKTGVPVRVAALKRTKATPSQGQLSAGARKRNVAGAFAVRARYVNRVQGKRIVLVDDVLTTGATLGGCVRALKRGGATRVDVLVLARVVRARDTTI